MGGIGEGTGKEKGGKGKGTDGGDSSLIIGGIDAGDYKHEQRGTVIGVWSVSAVKGQLMRPRRRVECLAETMPEAVMADVESTASQRHAASQAPHTPRCSDDCRRRSTLKPTLHYRDLLRTTSSATCVQVVDLLHFS